MAEKITQKSSQAETYEAGDGERIIYGAGAGETIPGEKEPVHPPGVYKRDILQPRSRGSMVCGERVQAEVES